MVVVSLVLLLAVGYVNAATYNCPIEGEGDRIHESVSSTPYDCVDDNCGNTCRGGQCVAYVVCKCTNPSTGNAPPGSSCWSPGTHITAGGGCDSGVAYGTAVATFNSNGNYNGHAGAFIECSGNNVRLWDQWCCRELGRTWYTPTSSWHHPYLYTIDLKSGCSERNVFSCRQESGGGTCCPTSVAGCLAKEHWIPDDVFGNLLGMN